MYIYKDIITGDEMFSSSYKYEVRDGFYVIKAKYVTRKADDVDESALGANPSAEEAAEESECGSESGLNVVLDNRLQETGFGVKKDYQVYMKDYMKCVFAKLSEKLSAEEVAKAKANALEAFKIATGKFKDWQFFTGESMNAEGHIALVEWKDEEVDGQVTSVPYMYFYQCGMEEEKV